MIYAKRGETFVDPSTKITLPTSDQVQSSLVRLRVLSQFRFVPELPIRLCDSSNMHIETISILALLYLGLGLCEGRVRGRQFDEEDETIVELPKLGAIQGKTIETAWTKREVLQFVDIRYAEPPTGKYRFKVCLQNINQVLLRKSLDASIL